MALQYTVHNNFWWPPLHEIMTCFWADRWDSLSRDIRDETQVGFFCPTQALTMKHLLQNKIGIVTRFTEASPSLRVQQSDNLSVCCSYYQVLSISFPHTENVLIWCSTESIYYSAIFLPQQQNKTSVSSPLSWIYGDLVHLFNEPITQQHVKLQHNSLSALHFGVKGEK